MPPIEPRIIAERFNAWLARYTPPRHIAADSAAVQAEADALLRILLKRAPAVAVDKWIDRVCELLDERATTRAWPTGGEIKRAAEDARGEFPPTEAASPGAPEVGSRAWSLSVRARRIAAGEPVSEHDLWGRDAAEMLRAGLVSWAQIEAARKAHVQAWVEAWGEDAACHRLAILERRHRDAEAAAAPAGGDAPAPQRRGRQDVRAAVARIMDRVAERRSEPA